MTTGERGQAVVSGVLLVMILTLLAGGIVDVYRLQEARSWAYRAAEASALAGVTLGRDLSTVYWAGRPRVDPAVGFSTAEDVLLEALVRRGAVGAAYQVEVLEWGGTVAGFPPLARADLWGVGDWTCEEPAVGVYVALPIETFVLGLAIGDRMVTVHAFAAAAVGEW